jgi:hypothetical protein
VNLLEGVGARGGAAEDAPAYAASAYETIVAPYVENWRRPDPQKFAQFYSPEGRMINPGFERPLCRDELASFYTALIGGTVGLQLHLQRWAATPGLLFIQWSATGKIAGKPLDLPVIDRFTLDGNLLATEGVSYFDNLGLRAMAEPGLARFRNLSFAAVPTDAAKRKCRDSC